MHIRFVVVLALSLAACKQDNPKAPSAQHFDRDEQLKLIDFLSPFDIPMGSPKPYEWLAVHHEPGQPFGKYIQIKPVRVVTPRTALYLQPIGEFSQTEKLIIQYTADYLAIFFNLNVEIQPVLDDQMVDANSRRYIGTSDEQLKTTPIMDYLEKNLPSDAVVMMAITTKDLYPNDQFNYVFGQARLKTRVGVSSIHRYYEGELTTSNYQQCLERLIKTSAHEIGHMFTIQHCTYAVCVMNGSNGLFESDLRPNRVCSDCLRKLQWNLGFPLQTRAQNLVNFFKKHRLESDYQLALRDLNVLEHAKL